MPTQHPSSQYSDIAAGAYANDFDTAPWIEALYEIRTLAEIEYAPNGRPWGDVPVWEYAR